MKRILLAIVALLLGASAALAISGWPAVHESLPVDAGVVTKITATTYQPGGAGTSVYPVLIQLNGAGYYRLDPFTSILASNYTPTANDYVCASGDVIEVEHPQYFRITPATSAFSAAVTSFSR